MGSDIKRTPGRGHDLQGHPTIYVYHPTKKDEQADDRKIATAQRYIAARNDLVKAIGEYGAVSPEAVLAEKVLLRAQAAYKRENKRG